MGQVVVSGTKAAVERAMALAFGKRRPTRHVTPRQRALSLPDDEHRRRIPWQDALANVTINANQLCPLIANVLATPITSPDEIRQSALWNRLRAPCAGANQLSYMAANGIETLI